MKYSAEIQRVFIAHNPGNFVNVILRILQKCFCIVNEAALIIHPITDNSFFPIFDASFVINVESKSITIVPERLAIDIAFILPK